jgi:hypothetical protein
MSYPLTLVDFELWLKSKNGSDVVGETVASCNCPVFNALRAKGISVLAVSTFTTDLDPKDDLVTNPSWVSNFIQKIDSLPQREVTSSQALHVLNNLYICTVCNKYNPEGTNCGKKDNCPW